MPLLDLVTQGVVGTQVLSGHRPIIFTQDKLNFKLGAQMGIFYAPLCFDLRHLVFVGFMSSLLCLYAIRDLFTLNMKIQFSFTYLFLIIAYSEQSTVRKVVDYGILSLCCLWVGNFWFGTGLLSWVYGCLYLGGLAMKGLNFLSI